MKVNVNYKTDEEYFECPLNEGLYWKQEIELLTDELGAWIRKAPWEIPYLKNGCITLPNSKQEIGDNPNIYRILLTEDLHSHSVLNGFIATFHELGHLIDCKQHDESVRNMVQEKGYHNIEVKAWEYAFKLAHKIDFPYFDELYEVSLKCLWSYFQTEGYPLHDEMDLEFEYIDKTVSWYEAVIRIDKAYEEVTDLQIA